MSCSASIQSDSGRARLSSEALAPADTCRSSSGLRADLTARLGLARTAVLAHGCRSPFHPRLRRRQLVRDQVIANRVEPILTALARVDVACVLGIDERHVGRRARQGKDRLKEVLPDVI